MNPTKFLSWLFVAAFICLPCFADTLYSSYSIPQVERPCALMKFGIQEPFAFQPTVEIQAPPFPTSFGTFTKRRIIFNASPRWGYRAENASAFETPPIQWGRAFAMNVVYQTHDRLGVPLFDSIETNPRNTVGDFGGIVGASVPNPYMAAFPPRAAFDGVVDWTGPSGLSVEYGGGYTFVFWTDITSPQELAYFSNPNGGKFYIAPRMHSSTTIGFVGHWPHQSAIEVNINGVTFIDTYTPYPSTP